MRNSIRLPGVLLLVGIAASAAPVPPVTGTGKGLIIYRDDADGRWRLARDAWNSDSASKAP